MSTDSEDDWDEDWGDDQWDGDDEEETIDCPECGETVYLISDKCPQCGHWFLDEEKVAGAFGSRVASDLKSPMGMFLIGIGLLILVLLLLLIP